MNRVANPWATLVPGTFNVLASDAAAIDRFNARAKPEYRVQPDLLPEPFFGSPEAPVVILNLNPGFSEKDRVAHADPEFRSAVLRGLRHEPQQYPFHYLDPEGTAPGHDWWRSRLARVLDRVPLEEVSARLLCIEYFPYHSKKYANASIRLQSQAYGFELARQAVARGAVVVLFRGRRPWFAAVPELETHSKVFYLRSRQHASISPRNCPDGFEHVVEALLLK